MKATRFRRMQWLAVFGGLACQLFLAFLVVAPGPCFAAEAYKVLAFSKTTGFRHDSIANGKTMLQQVGATNNFAVDMTDTITAQRRSRAATVFWLRRADMAIPATTCF